MNGWLNSKSPHTHTFQFFFLYIIFHHSCHFHCIASYRQTLSMHTITDLSIIAKVPRQSWSHPSLALLPAHYQSLEPLGSHSCFPVLRKSTRFWAEIAPFKESNTTELFTTCTSNFIARWKKTRHTMDTYLSFILFLLTSLKPFDPIIRTHTHTHRYKKSLVHIHINTHTHQKSQCIVG